MTPLLPLDTFREILGWNPYHFWQLANSDQVPINQSCDTLLFQHNWQNTDAAGRLEILQAIETAEGKLRDYLGFDIAPRYRTVSQPWSRYYDASRDRILPADSTGRWIAPRLLDDCGYVQAIGTELLTLLGTATLGAELVFSRQFNPATGPGSVNDTFTITLTVPAGTDPDDLAVYFAAADMPDGSSPSDASRIQPVKCTVSGMTATVVGRIWLLVRPVLYQGLYSQPLDPNDVTSSGPYAQSLLVYLRQTNPDGTTIETSMGTVVWETTPCHGWWCCCAGCSGSSFWSGNAVLDPAAIATALARVALRDPRLGVVGLGQAVYNTSTGEWCAVAWGACREPDTFTVRLLAGFPLENQNVAKKYQAIVARLAMAEMARPVCGCETANRELYRWQFDLARSGGTNDEQFAYISRDDLSNPFGTRRGHVYAWKEVRNLRQVIGVIGS